MFGLGGIKRMNDNWIAKQANHEAMLNRAREHADRAAEAAGGDVAAEQAHANYKCGGTLRPPLVIGIDDNGEAITLP